MIILSYFIPMKPQISKSVAKMDRMGAQIRLEKELRFIVSVPTDRQQPLIVEAGGGAHLSEKNVENPSRMRI